MTRGYEKEFVTVDAVIATEAETLGVDAFALSIIKAERQLRKLVTHLVFQSPAFDQGDVEALQDALSTNRSVYFDGVERGFNALYPASVQELLGNEYARLRKRLSEATEYRNKIFHGQLTGTSLSRSALLSLVKDIREWCRLLASGAEANLGFDGFTRNSFQKSRNRDLASQLKVQIGNLQEYKQFIANYMQRGR